MTKIKTISVLGPTASGKTGLAIALAGRLNGEVVSCDSMQLYRGMDIGTATPTVEERDGIVHHMFDIVDPEEEFSAADYARIAAGVIEDIASRGKLPILCGGTGMYHDSLMRITGYSEGEKDEALREELYRIASEQGNEVLHARLREIDPEAADAIHPNNVKRVVRAIEVFETTGKTKTETDREQIAGEVPYDDTVFILEFADRDLLYSRIEKRVDIMMHEGLEEEAKNLLCTGRNVSRTAAQAIGYKEFLPYFAGEKTLDEVSAEIKLATRHYAKRQLIWFRRMKDVHRLVPDLADGTVRSAESLAEEAASFLK
ncbi:MAG: tRNA (adenosine(37)-N6)-dimethylallyltransferase MiaA [Clostridia bacterium]|nr:tRNA (adenosine(37)-N6)-dimethylallyltransferase MiaA [Clostridia bacterium]